MFRKAIPTLFALAGAFAVTAAAGPQDANLYIISPADGQAVHGPVTVQFGLSGMGVAPSGVQQPNTGHHHLLIDVDDLPPMDKPVPSDDRHRHFGGGQTQATLDLPPGKHTLQLLFAGADHIPHDPPVVSERITVTVK